MTRSASSARIGGDIAVRRQSIRHPGGIIHVHLAAVGLDEQLLGHASAATSPGIACGYGQTGTRSATCHADRLALPHDIFMGIRKDRVKRPGWQARRSPAVRTGATLPSTAASDGRSEERQAPLEAPLHRLQVQTRTPDSGPSARFAGRRSWRARRRDRGGKAPGWRGRMERRRAERWSRRGDRQAAPRLVRARGLVPSPIFLASALRCCA